MSSMFNTIATVERLQTYSGDQSTYASTGASIEGRFDPISPDMDQMAQGVLSQTYQFITEAWEDIQDNDQLTIDSEVYGVMGTSTFRRGSVEYLRCLLEKVVNE